MPSSRSYPNFYHIIPSTELENKMVCSAEVWVKVLQGKEWCWTNQKAGPQTMFTVCHNQRSQAGKLLQVSFIYFPCKVQPPDSKLFSGCQDGIDMFDRMLALKKVYRRWYFGVNHLMAYWWNVCGRNNCRLVFPWRTFYMYAATEDELKEWIKIIKWKLV